MGAEATIDGPTRRRTSWSLKTIVEDVAGRPIGELQDPERPVHPYLKGRDLGVRSEPARPSRPLVEAYDPVDHLYPPLVGPTGREFHGPDYENHAETIDRHRPLPGHVGGPSHRPERLYLHYLLLHMDRLSASALRYLKLAVDEELAHRAEPPPLPAEGSSSEPGS
ncbi:MAG TPA: hypothetical protein VJ021_06200 [Thermoplasmata archaeon]|nr:hypothetical protein [Thermoplasmata archaeon]